MAAEQISLFPISNLPDGLLYQPDFLTEDEESELIQTFRTLRFADLDFQGYIARRRVLEFGLEYDFSTRSASPTETFPQFILPFRERAAQFAGLTPMLWWKVWSSSTRRELPLAGTVTPRSSDCDWHFPRLGVAHALQTIQG